MSESDSVNEHPAFSRGGWVQNDAFDDDSSVAISYVEKKKNARNQGYKWTVCVSQSGKEFRVRYYDTAMTPGRKIRNAVTGELTSHVVGGTDEYLYFSNIVATGEYGQTPDVLFYDSPEQFERHMHVTISDEAKEMWRQRYNAILREQQEQLSNREYGAAVVVK